MIQKYFQREAPGELDTKTMQRALWLSDFLKLEELGMQIIKQSILPMLSRENVLIFLEESYTKITSMNPTEEEDDLSESWNLLLTESLDLAAKNFPLLVRLQKEVVNKLDDFIVDELIEKAFKTFSAQLSSDNSAIIEFLLERKGNINPFKLLKLENSRVTNKEKASFMDPKTLPTLTWNLQNLRDEFYRESEVFPILGCYWILCICRFRKENNLCISIKNTKNPKEYDESSSNSYYNKNKYFVNPSKKRIPNQRNTEDKVQPEVIEGRIPNHCILTLASLIRVKEIEEENKGVFNIVSLLTGSKSQTVLRKIPIQDLPDTEGKLSIEIYLRVEYTYSGILAFISKNFDWLYNCSDIIGLTKSEFVILLKHKYLNVKREEDVLAAFCIWRKV